MRKDPLTEKQLLYVRSLAGTPWSVALPFAIVIAMIAGAIWMTGFVV